MKSVIEKSLNNTEIKENYYLGNIKNGVKEKITDDLGFNIFKNGDYAFSISSDDIRHIKKHFESVDDIVEAIYRLYDVVNNYDSVSIDEEEKQKYNKNKLIFNKHYNDFDYRSVEIVSKKNRTFDLVSFFITKNNKKRNKDYGLANTTKSGELASQTVSVSNNNISQDNSNVKYALKEYSKHQIENWKNSKKIVIYESQEQLQNFIDDARAHKNLNQKMYFGIVPNDMAEFIENETGVDVSNCNISLRADSIIKIFNDHGSELTELPRGQRPITDQDILNLPLLIESIDSAENAGEYTGMNNNGDFINLKSRFDNSVTIGAFKQGKYLDLRIHTMYAKNKKGNYATTVDTNAPTSTSETSNGKVSFASRLPQKDTTVNSNDMQDKTRYSLKEHPYSYKTLTSKPDMKIIEIDDKKDYAPNKPTREDVVNNALVSALSVGHKDRSGNIFVYVDDIDTNVMVSKRGLRHSLDRRLSIIAPVTENIGAILKNSIRINELTPEFDTIEKSYALIGIAKNNNNEPYVVSFIVNKASNEIISVDVLYAVNAKKEATALIEPELSSQSDVSLTASTISISDLLDYVNKYYPDILPEDVLKHYGYKSRPEGVLGESALYSRKEQAINYNALLEENKELSAANKDLQRMLKLTANQNEKLKNEFKITNRHNISNNALDKVAVQLRRQYSSKYSKSALVSRLSALYDYIANAGSDIEMGYIWNNAYDIALNIIDNSQHKDTSVYDEYKELRDYIRTTSIRVPESVQNFKMQG